MTLTHSFFLISRPNHTQLRKKRIKKMRIATIQNSLFILLTPLWSVLYFP